MLDLTPRGLQLVEVYASQVSNMYKFEHARVVVVFLVFFCEKGF